MASPQALDDALVAKAEQQRKDLARRATGDNFHGSASGAPLTLPMIGMTAGQYDSSSNVSDIPEKQRAISSAGAFSSASSSSQLTSSNGWREGELMMVSLPSTLPVQDLAGSAHSPAAQQAESSEAVRAKAAKLPAGPAGRYRVYKSGRAEMTLHGVPLELTHGVTRQHVEQLAAAVITAGASGASSSSSPPPSSGEFVSLGPVRNALVGSIALEELLDHAGSGNEAKRRLVEEYLAMPRQRA